MDLVTIGTMNLHEAKEFQKQLKDKGIEIVLNHNEESCTRGCTITVELCAKEADIPSVQKTYAENFQKSLEGHDVDLNQLNSVFDPSSEKVTCPACGHDFKPTGSECPDCGLMF